MRANLFRVGLVGLMLSASVVFAVDLSDLGKDSQENFCAFAVAEVLDGPAIAALDFKVAARIRAVRDAANGAKRKAEGETSYAKSQLALPNEMRDQRDPRWFFVGLRGGDATNPVRIELELRKEIGPAVAALVTQLDGALTELSQLDSNIQRLPEKSDLELAMKRLLQAKLADIEGELSALESVLPKTPNDNEARSRVIAAVEALEKIAKKVQRSIDLPDHSELWARVEEGRIAQANAVASQVMGRELANSTVKELLSLAVRNKIRFIEVVTYFKELDDVGYQRDEDGVKDRWLLLVAEIGLRRKVEAAPLMERFLALDKAGNHDDWSTYDREVAVLVDVSLAHDLGPEAVAKKFMEISERGTKQRDDFHIIDEAAVLLTALSYQHDLTAKQVIDKFFEVYDEFKRPFSLGDIAVTIILGLQLQHQSPEGQLFERYVALKGAVNKAGIKLPTEAMARVFVLATHFNLGPEAAASLFRRSVAVAGQNASFERALTVMAIASASERGEVQTEGQVTDEDLAVAARLSFLTLTGPYDHLKEKKTTPRSRSRSSSDGRSSSDDDDSSSSGTGLGVTLGSDGLHPTANFGGFGIDLTDGSPTINLGGGFSIDTDGDGFGVKLF